MADTIRTRVDQLTQLPVGQPAAVTAQAIRDLLVTVFGSYASFTAAGLVLTSNIAAAAITSWTVGASSDLVVSASSAAPNIEGDYLIGFCASIQGVAGRTYSFGVSATNSSAVPFAATAKIDAGADICNLAFAGIAHLKPGSVQITHACDQNAQALTLTNASFYLRRVGG